jgi:hypothetical protein
MAWQATANEQDKLWAALVYLFPLIMAAPLSLGVLGLLVPQLALVLLSIGGIIAQVPFLSLIIFFGLYVLVVRNSQIAYFIRYNTMQALLIEIAIVLYMLVAQLFSRLPGVNFLFQVTDNLLFLGSAVVIIYCIVQCLRGIYPELRILSDAVKSQLG